MRTAVSKKNCEELVLGPEFALRHSSGLEHHTTLYVHADNSSTVMLENEVFVTTNRNQMQPNKSRGHT